MNQKSITAIAARLAKLEGIIDDLSNPLKDEVLLTSDQMLVLLNCSPATLYRLRSKGVIPCVKVGGQYRYPKLFFTTEIINSISKGEDPSKRFDDK